MKIYNIKTTYELVEESAACKKLTDCRRVVDYMQGAFDERPDQESFWVLLLDRKNTIKGREMITLGTLNSSLVHSREVFRTAIREGAAAIIVCHNHPSGDPAPSTADIKATRQLREASQILGINLLDHVIIGDIVDDPQHIGYYSFEENGLI